MAIWELLNQKHEHFQTITEVQKKEKWRELDDEIRDDKKAAGSF